MDERVYVCVRFGSFSYRATAIKSQFYMRIYIYLIDTRERETIMLQLEYFLNEINQINAQGDSNINQSERPNIMCVVS